jgi:hypothetical protein
VIISYFIRKVIAPVGQTPVQAGFKPCRIRVLHPPHFCIFRF